LQTTGFEDGGGGAGKWRKRAVSNLLFYQSNYLALVVLCLAMYGLAAPRELVDSVTTISLAVIAIILRTNNQLAVRVSLIVPHIDIIAK